MAKEPLSEIAGQRLRIARKQYGFSQMDLPGFERWQKYFPDVNNDKSIRGWERDGFPLFRIDNLGACFRVSGSFFLSEKVISDEDFETAIQLMKTKMQT